MKLIEKIERKLVQKLLRKYPEYQEVVQTNIIERRPLNLKRFSAEYRHFTSTHYTQSEYEECKKDEMALLIGKQIVRAGAYKSYEINPQPDDVVKTVRWVVEVVVPENRRQP